MRYSNSLLIIFTTTFLCSATIVAQDRFELPGDARVIDVTSPEWGAIPDDNQDDTAAIQRIFDLLTPTGRIIYFPDGQYDLSDQIILEKKAFSAQAEDLPSYGWTLQQEGDRTYLEAVDAADNPDDAGRITFEFDAIEADRVLVFAHRVPSSAANSFYYRINGGEWRANNRNFNGNANWREGVMATGLPLQTGANRLEIAVLDPGFQIDRIDVAYLANYLGNTIIQGESMDGVTLKLADNTLNAGGQPFDGAVIAWEPGVAQFFRTAVRDLTIDVGSGNPLADGLKFHGNNQSTVRNVRFIGRDGSGDVALDLAHSTQIGPALFENIQVDGFAIGIHSAFQIGSRTFQTVTLENQREFGWLNETASSVYVSDLTSLNSVPAFYNTGNRLPGDGQGRVVLVNGVLDGLPGAETVAAITNFGPSMYLRDIVTNGYDVAVANNNQLSFRGFNGQDGIDGDYIGEWWSHGADTRGGGGLTSVFDDAPDTSAGLRIRTTPQPRYGRVSQWVGPHMFETVLADGSISGRPNDDIDDTVSIQAALDSGAKTIYFPNGSWTLNGDLVIPESVSNLLGLESGLLAADLGAEPRIVIPGERRKKLFIERFANFAFAGGVPRFEQAGRRTLIFSNITGLNFRSVDDRPSLIFINDAVGNAIRFSPSQQVFARQLNIEENTTLPDSELDAKIVNDGARVWVLGFKTENPGVHVKTINGGVTEILGNLHANQFSDQTPQYVTVDSSLSVVTNIQPVVDAGSTYGTFVETRDGETRTGQIAGTGYSALDSDYLWRTRREIVIDDDSETVNYVGDWSEVASFPRGHIGTGFRFARPSGESARVEYSPRIRSNDSYDVYVRWIGDWGGQPHSGHSSDVTVRVTHLDGIAETTVDQLQPSDGWYFVGNYRFSRGTAADPLVTIESALAGKTVNTDGVRFVRNRQR